LFGQNGWFVNPDGFESPKGYPKRISLVKARSAMLIKEIGQGFFSIPFDQNVHPVIGLAIKAVERGNAILASDGIAVFLLKCYHIMISRVIGINPLHRGPDSVTIIGTNAPYLKSRRQG
jgi:hypothetical protein